MQKTILERFIAKYNLGGAAEAVLWTTEKKELSTRFISDDKNVLGIVSTSEATFAPAGEYGVYETGGLSRLISALTEDIKISVNKNGTKAQSLTVRDAANEATFVIADPSVIPSVPDLKALPDFDLNLTLTPEFMTTFVRGKNALPDVETFTVMQQDGKTQIVIGYSPTVNTNRFSLSVEAGEGETLDRPLNFSARYMKEILAANKEARGGTISISSKGLAHVTFDIDGFAVDYYLVEIQTS